MRKIRIGIAGYGNLGKGVELAIRQNDDMELAGIFTRRDPSTLKPLQQVLLCSAWIRYRTSRMIST